jgi:hypothetical protein
MSSIKLDHVPLLQDVASFPEWKRLISLVLKAEGYWTHVEGTANPWDIYPASRPPATPDAASAPVTVTAYQTWWQKDAKAHDLILRRISPVTSSHLDSSVGITARDTWKQLHTMYARVDIMAQFDLKEKVQSLQLKDFKDLERYLGEFRTTRERFVAMKVAYPEDDMVHQIIRGLPSSGSWPHFRQLMVQTMQDHIDKELAAAAAGGAAAAPDTLLNRVINCITIECQRLESESASKKARPGSEYSNAAAESSGPIRKHSKNPNGVRCTNCSGITHDVDHCWAEGGGMEGKGPKGKKKKGAEKSSSAKKDSASLAAGTSTDADTLSSGELSCASIAGAAADEDDEELANVAANWATILDSGATSHLIKSREYFWTYNPENARPVTTANMGMLKMEACGECRAIVTFAGRRTRIKLRDCLHSPRACANLLSVGRLSDANITSTFTSNSVILSRNGAAFASGDMVNRLFHLDIEFIPAPVINNDVVVVPRTSQVIEPPPSETVLFTKVKESLELWHQRLGHPGITATRALLRSVTGIKLYPGADTRLTSFRCEPCIISKHTANLHPSKTSPSITTTLLELVHCDICGPFPTETPHKKIYFIAFLDDATSVNNVQLLATRDQALEAFIIVKAKWERKTGKKILRFRCDGAGEFRGDFAKHLELEGVEVDVTAPYEHWMNGKIERFMRTIESRIRAMMTTAQLPETYWGEAALTASYLLNLTTTSTLPNGKTPFEVFHGRRPDITHLRTWGTRCFAHVPRE